MPDQTAIDSAGAVSSREEDEVSLLDLLIVLAKHKRIVLGVPAGVAALAIIYSLLATNIYTATARILPPQQNPSTASALLSQLGGLASLFGGVAGLRNSEDVYLAMLKSRTVADNLIKRFGLMSRYEVEYPTYARARLESQSRITSGKDGLITVEVEDKDPKFAADLANAYVEELINLSNTLAVTEAGKRRLFFERQLRQAGEDLAKSEIAARSALQEGGVAMVDEQGKSMIGSIAGLRAQITVKEVQINAMSGFAAEQNPELLRARQELSALRQQLAKLEGSGAATRALTGGKGMSQGLENVSLIRDLKFNEALYELLAKQYGVAKIDEAREGAVVQLMDKAIVPDRRTHPKRTQIVVLATLAGGLLGLMLAFVAEALARAREDPVSSQRLRKLADYLRWHRSK